MLTKSDIKLIKSLSDKNARRESGLFVAEGEKLVGEVLESGMNAERIFFTGKADINRWSRYDVEIISNSEMERISHLKTPSSALALVKMPEYRFSSDIFRDRLVLALDNVQDPGNLGTIIRVADWFGVSDIVCSLDSADCFNPKVVQATMGALLRVKVHYTDLLKALDMARQVGVNIYGTFLEGENIYDSKLSDSGVIIMGNEGRGISPAVSEKVSHKLLIPDFSVDVRGSESLNVAVATAIVCSEFRRR